MPSNPLKRYQHGNTPCYALVTGATGGMGEQWAHQLAGLGFNVIIHGRNAEKLASVREAILTKHKSSHPSLEVMVAAADATRIPPNLGELTALLPSSSKNGSEGIAPRISVLINNLGVTTQEYPLLEEVPQEDLLGMISANALFPTVLSQKVLPILKKNEPSLMVNVSSLGAWAPSPYLSSYSGAKAYNLLFSRSLYNEMRAEGSQLDVVAVAPGQVVSGMNEGPPTAMMPTSEAWVRTTIKKLSGGLFSSRPPPVMIPWGMHSFGARAMKWMPRSMSDATVRSTVVDLRKKKIAEKKPGGQGAQHGRQDEEDKGEDGGVTTTATSSAEATAVEENAEYK